MALEEGSQYLKTRDDPSPVLIQPSQDSLEDSDKPFQISEGSECSWASKETLFGSETLRPRIEPWLTALVQSEHLSLLIGSGLTHAVHGMATSATLQGMSHIEFNVFKYEIEREAKRIANAARRNAGNLEDQVRAATDLLRGLEIIANSELNGAPLDEQVSALQRELNDALNDFANSILQGESSLVLGDKREQAFNYLVSFLMSFASRTGTRERLHMFTTNYDRLIEAGADTAGLRLVDRFVGTLAPVFRSSRLDVDLHYNPPGIRGEPRYLEGVARFTKLHGSIDWIDHGGAIRRIGLPFGANATEPYLSASGSSDADAFDLMIYPNASKDRETSSFPYVELFRDFAAAICRPNSTLISYGYSFGDDHINRVIEDMLTIPSAHLVIISYNDPLERILDTYRSLGRHAQISLLIGNHLGDLRTLVDHYLPKSAIDRTTYRMAEILKARWNTRDEIREGDGGDSTGEGDSVS